MASQKYDVPYWPLAEAMSTGQQWMTIVLEGNIGARKSTLLNYFPQPELYEVISEPVENWKDCAGYNILKLSYTEPELWMFKFETNVFINHTKLHRKSCQKPIKVMERSIYGARNCFAENSYNMGLLNAAEYKILDDLFQINTEKGDCPVGLFVYLRTDPSRCMERLERRRRPEETTVNIAYLRNLHQLYEQWFCPSENIMLGDTKTPIVVIDGNRTKEEVLKETQTKIQDFLTSKGMVETIS